MRVAVYGNLVYDTILRLTDEFRAGHSNLCELVGHRAGGIANVCRALKALDSKTVVIAASCVGQDAIAGPLTNGLMEYVADFDVTMSIGLSSQAIIVLDTQSTRTSFVQWGACRRRELWLPAQTSWYHIAYLDQTCITPDQIACLRETGIVSADLCDHRRAAHGSHLYEKFCQLDYLFASESEATAFTNSSMLDSAQALATLTKRGAILHSPTEIVCCLGTSRMHKQITPRPNLNVLGAGDYFAAGCILAISSGNLNLGDLHAKTVSLLETQS